MTPFISSPKTRPPSKSQSTSAAEINFVESIEGIPSLGGPPLKVSSRDVVGSWIDNPLRWADSAYPRLTKKSNVPANIIENIRVFISLLQLRASFCTD